MAAALVVWLTACSSKSLPFKVFTLNTPEVQMVKSTKYRNKTMKVTFPQTLKEQISNKMYYVYSTGERGAYLNSQWSNNIGKLLEGTFILALEQSRMYKAVIPYSSTAAEDYRLESTIFDFAHHVEGKASYAIVSIQFSLIDTETGHLVKTKRFSYREETPTFNAEGYAKATNRAVERLSRDLVAWLD